jgi:hypothetical protein
MLWTGTAIWWVTEPHSNVNALSVIFPNAILMSVILKNAVAPCWMAAKCLHFSMSRKFSGIIFVPPKVDQFGHIFQKLAILQLAGWNSNFFDHS